MITVATLLWSPNVHSHSFSRAYDETWVDKLYQGVARNLTGQFRFVVYTDRERKFGWPVEQKRIEQKTPNYGACIQPYELNEPMILVGLDTIICGNIDHLAEYCLTENVIALPRDPYHTETVCNGVALVPAGKRYVWETFEDGGNDMRHMQRQKHRVIDDLWPGHVVSYKAHYCRNGHGDARIVYFHGEGKPDRLADKDLIKQHWL